MALRPFNTVGGLSVGPNVANVLVSTNNGDSNVANYVFNTTDYGNVTLGNVGNLHIAGGLAYVAVGTANVFANGAVDTITLSNVGFGYDIAPTITITGANTSNANISATLAANGSISGFTYNSRGTGYANGTIGVTISSPGTKYLKTDGSGNLAFFEVQATGGGSGTPGGANTQVQYNDGGMFSGSNAFIFDESNATTTFGNVLSIAGNTSGNIDDITTATITSSANTNFNITGAANANLAIRASNNRASLSSNGASGSTLVGYANANANLSAANLLAVANTVTITAAANASNTTGNSSSVTVASDSGVSATSNFGNVTLAVTSSGNDNAAKANAALSNTAITLQTAANGANATGNSASFTVTTTGITGTAANGNVTLGTTVQGNTNGARGNVIINNAAVTLQTAANGANTTGNSASLGVTTTGITAAAANGNITLSTTVQGGANDAQGNVIINNAAVTLQTASNAANANGNSSSITLGTTSGVTATSTNGNVTLAVTTASDDNSAKANARISNTTITLAAASNGANTTGNLAAITLGATTGANVSVNTGNISLYYTDGASSAGNMIISNNSIAFSTQSNTSNTNLARAVFNLRTNAESNIVTSGNIVLKSDANLANTFSSAQITLNGNANSITLGANANSTVVITDIDATVNGNMLITGNLTVQGNAIYANTETLTVEDPIIQLGTGANGAVLTTNDGKDRGLELHTYGDGNTYNANGAITLGSTVITIADTRGIANGMVVTTLTGAIPIGTTVTDISTNANITISAATTANITNGQALQIGNDTLRFMGWSNTNGEYRFYSNATNTNEVITGTLANVRAANLIGTLANGNSNIAITSNANIVLTANGNTVTTFTSNGDGNLQLIGSNTVGYVSATGNVIAIGNVQSNNHVVLEGVVQFSTDYSNTSNYFSNIGAATLTTTTTTANQAIIKIPAAVGRSVEFIIKGSDSTGAKYERSTIAGIVTAANVIDYTTFGVVGNSVGTITVAITDSNANIALQVTPASTNSTVFTTQYRVL